MSDHGHGHSHEGGTTARNRMFGVAVLVGLASGSNYVYSGYAPQLASKLGITSTDSNLIGLGGNLGMYLSGVLWGIIVDKRGPRMPLICAALLNFVGYSSVRLFYLGVFPVRFTPDGPPVRGMIFLLTFCMFLTGSGASAGLTSAMNAVAKSFPDRSRAAATGSVLAGFGLSAFLFSTMGQLFYHGDAGGLLFLLSIGTALPSVLGTFIIRAYPVEGGTARISLDITDEEECVLARQLSITANPEGQLVTHRDVEPDHEMDASGTPPSPTDPLLRRRPRSDSSGSIPPTQLHYTPWDVFQMLDFHLLFTVLALLCGVGLEWINNVGAVTLALARKGWDYDPREVSAYQARQVATISIFNCLGRIVAGVLSDYFKLRYSLKRIWFLPIVALMFLASEISVIKTTDVKNLWLVSASLGLAYGSMFNVIPMLVLEWFGMTHFSQNYGYVTLAPIFGGNVFNLVFGRVYDSNTVGRIGGPEPPLLQRSDAPASAVAVGFLDVWRAARVSTRAVAVGTSIAAAAGAAGAASLVAAVQEAAQSTTDSKNECIIGVQCYAAAFRISAIGCVIALLLSVIAGIRRERLSAERKRHL